MKKNNNKSEPRNAVAFKGETGRGPGWKEKRVNGNRIEESGQIVK